MSGLSRRNFMSGVAVSAGTVGVAAAAPQDVGDAAGLALHAHDDAVGVYYCGKKPNEKDVREFLNESGRTVTGPHTGIFLYGLLCADLNSNGDAPEVLVPFSGGTHKVHLYTAAEASNTDGSTYIKDGVRRWPLENCTVTVTPLDLQNNPVEAPGRECKKLNRRGRHPWVEYSTVRELEKLTSRTLIGGAKRDRLEFVTCRVKLPGGWAEPVLPYSALGRWAEWGATHGGREIVSATTDTLVHVRPWPPAATRILVKIVNRADSTLSKDVIFKLADGQAVFAITNAMRLKLRVSMDLEDTRAFAHLLDNMTPGAYPVPELKRGCYGELPKSLAFTRMERIIASTRDGHCECAYVD